MDTSSACLTTICLLQFKVTTVLKKWLISRPHTYQCPYGHVSTICNLFSWQSQQGSQQEVMWWHHVMSYLKTWVIRLTGIRTARTSIVMWGNHMMFTQRWSWQSQLRSLSKNYLYCDTSTFTLIHLSSNMQKNYTICNDKQLLFTNLPRHGLGFKTISKPFTSSAQLSWSKEPQGMDRDIDWINPSVTSNGASADSRISFRL